MTTSTLAGPFADLSTPNASRREPPALSVVIATYNRAASLSRLLGDLANQTMSPLAFEVIVVDDGSSESAAEHIRSLGLPYALSVLEQPNAGPAAARHRGVAQATGDVVLSLDDDMRVAPGFLEAHLAAHSRGSHQVVLGRLECNTQSTPLHERFSMFLLERRAEAVRRGLARIRGGDLYTGNASFRRADYLAVGGFDSTFRLSEDAELGVRLEKAGVEFVLSEQASALHDTDHTDRSAWIRRSIAYGGADSRLSEKHSIDPEHSPWRFLGKVSRISRPFLLASALAPSVLAPVAWLAMQTAELIDRLGFRRLAMYGMTFTYGLLYYRGVREHAGSARNALGQYRRYLNRVSGRDLGVVANLAKLGADILADHDFLRYGDEKHRGRTVSRLHLPLDAIQRIGFQILIAYRVMRFLRVARFGLPARILSRCMRHLYGCDIHFDADLAPGVSIIHGMGLVIAPGARVARGGILFQHVTLGQSAHPGTREIGVPTLEADVHVGPGASLLGPITVGQGSKIMASAVLMESVPARSLVEVPAPRIRVRPDRASIRRADDPAAGEV